MNHRRFTRAATSGGSNEKLAKSRDSWRIETSEEKVLVKSGGTETKEEQRLVQS